MYRVYGLRLASEMAFPHLLTERTAKRQPPDLVLRLRSTAGCDAADAGQPGLLLWEQGESNHPSLSVHDVAGSILFRYRRREVFAIDPGLRTVTCFRRPELDDEFTGLLFLTLVASFILQRRGRPALHAAAVQCGNEAIAFLAPSGGGKSSLTAYCVGLGHGLLTDDLLPVQLGTEGLAALPGPPMLRLCPDSVGKLWGGLLPLPRHAREAEKRQVWLPLSKRFYCAEPLRLRALYFLERSGDGTIGLRPLSQREAVVALIGSVYGNFLSSRECLSRQLALFATAVPTVACRRLRVPSDFGALPAVYATIQEDLATTAPERGGHPSRTAKG